MGDQIIIKVILVIVLLLLMVVLFVQRPGARPMAIRRLTFGVLLLAAIAAVIFPSWSTWLAELVGVGRGADLVLYGLVLVFISHLLSSRIRHAQADQRFTALARHIAISEAEPAAAAGTRLAAQTTPHTLTDPDSAA